MPNEDTANSHGAGANVISNSRLVRITLSLFSRDDPELWFLAAE